jgi:hypothetical protein
MRVMDEFQSVEQLRWLPDLWTREASGLQLSMLARVVRPSLFRRKRDRQHLKADDMPPAHAEGS